MPDFGCNMQASLDHSIPIKRVEAGLKSLVLWGKILTQNGKVRTLRCAGARGPFLDANTIRPRLK